MWLVIYYLETTVNLSVSYDIGTVTINNTSGTGAEIQAATSTEAGVMSAADKVKLDGISSGADASFVDILIFG